MATIDGRSTRRGWRAGGSGARRRLGLVASVLAAAVLIVPLGLAAGSLAASATPPPPATTCSGTAVAPGVLAAGTYSSVTVSGVCANNAGQVVVTGNVVVQAGGALLAAYAKSTAGPGTSGLTVDGDIDVASGASLLLGCEAAHFACIDDPNQTVPTLNSSDTVLGSILATSPLGVVVHSSTVKGDAVQTGGGGGPSCAPSGIFTTFGSPVYSDYEDNTVGGNLRITGLTSCWLGAIRNTVGGSATISNNTLTDPDASENLANHVGGNLLCQNNSPAVAFGDSHSTSNVVGGFATGQCSFSAMAPNPAANEPPFGTAPYYPAGPLTNISVPSTAKSGYWLGAKDGGVFSFGVPFFGSQPGTPPTTPVVGLAAVPGGISYSLADANGKVFGFGTHAASCAGVSLALRQPIVAIAQAPGGNGCWQVASDGGVFTSGANASFYGSTGGIQLNKPIVGIAAAPDGNGYYLVASDGGVFTFGPGAHFQGSMGGKHLNQPIVGIAVDPVTGGYWLVARDGGIFSFGAPFLGSTGAITLNQPVVGLAAAPTGNGYYLVAADGGVFTFGPGAHFQGSTGAIKLVQPIVGITLG